uniref:Uncharacterized protein n=1 Tax=viral metagenome TaxID=1070528 RepID=A0A6C0ESY6_9ZZZZ
MNKKTSFPSDLHNYTKLNLNSINKYKGKFLFIRYFIIPDVWNNLCDRFIGYKNKLYTFDKIQLKKLEVYVPKSQSLPKGKSTSVSKNKNKTRKFKSI